MRQRMVRLGHADLRVRPRALLLADHERDDTREVRLERQQLQVEHQREMILEYRRRALRLLDRRQLEVPLLLGFLNTALDVADRFGVLVDLRLVARPELLLEAGELRGDRVEDALVLAQPGFARRPIRAAAVRTAVRTPRADSTPSAAAASGCATTGCA